MKSSQGGTGVWSLCVGSSPAPRGAQEGLVALEPCGTVAGLGPGGPASSVPSVSSVNRIKDQCKVSVRIPPDSEKSSLIRIEGDPQGVRQAKRELLELASRMVSLAGLHCAPAAGPRPSPTQRLTAGVCWRPSGSRVVVPTCSCG